MKIEQLSKKLSVPKKELEILGLEDEGTELQYADTLKEQLQKTRSDCESLFHPDVGFSSLIEYQLLTETHKKQLFKIFKESSKVLRDYEIAKIENNMIDWMKAFYTFWNKNKSTIMEINKHLSKKWCDEDSNKMMSEYLG